MKKLLLLFLFGINLAHAQTQEEQVISTLQSFFEALNSKDAKAMEQTVAFPEEMKLTSVFYSKRTETTLAKPSPFSDFLKSLEKESQSEDKWLESTWSFDVRIDGELASAWVPYSFFVNDKLSHCGANQFTLMKQEKGWKILSISDSRRRENCRTEEVDQKQIIHKHMETWHKLAANADDKYFDFMTDDAIYIGTDATERWTKQEFMKFAMPYFKKGKAWDFKTIRREVYFTGNEKNAWFEESLDTWMGECRASGVLEETADGWKILHYHLSLTVPNEKIEGFMKLVKEE